MWCSNFIDVFQHLNETLQVVELVNVTIGGKITTSTPSFQCCTVSEMIWIYKDW
jgi:hypothetical protein